jgi:hypothetical protein
VDFEGKKVVQDVQIEMDLDGLRPHFFAYPLLD